MLAVFGLSAVLRQRGDGLGFCLEGEREVLHLDHQGAELLEGGVEEATGEEH